MTNEERRRIDAWITAARNIDNNPHHIYSRVKDQIQAEIFRHEHFDNQENRERYDEMVAYASDEAGI